MPGPSQEEALINDPDSREIDALLSHDGDRANESADEDDHGEPTELLRAGAYGIRALALLCACSLSIGSHYGVYILAPLKSRLSREMGTSNTEFSLLISAFSLNSTWTPLVGGLLASRLGTTLTSILATGVILSGLCILLIGDLTEDVRCMTLGMFVFGVGVSPLAVVQETIIVRYFKSHGLGLSMAIGLLRQEARRISLEDVSEAQALKQVAEKKRVRSLREVADLGDVFWAYIFVNVLCGAIWHPFSQLSSNIIEHRFDLTERDASTQASFVLAGSIFLYPVVGFIIDRVKRPYFVIFMLLLSSVFTMLAFVWLVLPPSATRSAWPAIVSFGTGIGYAPLLLVVIVPQLVPTKYISTTLGAHKSLEQTGTVISQTLAGLILDLKKTPPSGEPPTSPSGSRYQRLLNAFLIVNVLQFVGIIALWYINRRSKKAGGRRQTASTEDAEETTPVLKVAEDGSVVDSESVILSHRLSNGHSPSTSRLDATSFDPLLPSTSSPHQSGWESNEPSADPKHSVKGRVFLALCAVLVLAAWVLFLATAWAKLRSKKDREGAGE
ncbi:major facilitator superfamily domain-containing protein [Amylostereum chailletii]|nr:major facilitator superfamily domain-containing protein [Amylostereum chailletii]